MADTCFPDYSALGVGNIASYDNELTEAPEEEEEFDVLNDETFGDFGEDDFDWNEQTEKFAEVLDPKYNVNRNNDSGFSTAEKTYKTQEEYMEQSISQLMVDDEDVESDPAVLNVHKSRPIPRKQQSLDMLFGPASPPSLLDAEYLVSPTSKNIWGSPVTEPQPPPQKHVNNIQSLFDFAKLAKNDAPLATIHGPHSRAAPMVLPKAQTLEEIENSLLRKPKIMTAEDLERQLRGEPAVPMQTPPRCPPNGHPGMSPAQFTVPPPNMVSPQNRHMSPHMAAGASPMNQNILGMMNGHRSPVLGAPIPIPMAGTPGHGTPIHMGGTPPYRNVSTPISRQSPVLTLTRRSPILRSPPSPLLSMQPQTPVARVPARFVTPYATCSQPRFIATPGRGFSQPIGIPRAMRGQPPPSSTSPYNSPQGVYGSPLGQYSSPQHYRMHQPGSFNDSYHNRNLNNNNNSSNRFQSPQQQVKSAYVKDNRNNRTDVNRQEYSNNRDNNREHRYYRPPYNQNLQKQNNERADHQRGHRGSRDDDDFAGIMTQKEKDWIIKIQLLQLQTENPYLDDYYYTSFCMKKKAKEREKDGTVKTDPKLVIPAMARLESRSYKPAQFEGSLGRLTTSSVHNPRQIIDLLAKSVSEAAGAGTKKMPTKVGKELRKSRQLLMDIEKGYNLLLDIDDLEKKILALPDEMRKPLLEERSYRIDLLFHYLLCDGNSAAFMQYMNVRKGRSLTTRALPLLDKVQSVGIVSLVCKNLQQLMKKDQSEENLEVLFEPCAKVIETCNLATIVMFVEDVQQEESHSTVKPIALALQNKLGSSLLCSLLHHGEEIYSTTSPVDLESNLQNEWCEFVHDFAGILATIPIESIVAPLQTYPDINDHLERLLNKRLMAVVEDNLRIFTHSDVVSNES